MERVCIGFITIFSKLSKGGKDFSYIISGCFSCSCFSEWKILVSLCDITQSMISKKINTAVTTLKALQTKNYFCKGRYAHLLWPKLYIFIAIVIKWKLMWPSKNSIKEIRKNSKCSVWNVTQCHSSLTKYDGQRKPE